MGIAIPVGLRKTNLSPILLRFWSRRITMCFVCSMPKVSPWQILGLARLALRQIHARYFASSPRIGTCSSAHPPGCGWSMCCVKHYKSRSPSLRRPQMRSTTTSRSVCSKRSFCPVHCLSALTLKPSPPPTQPWMIWPTTRAFAPAIGPAG